MHPTVAPPSVMGVEQPAWWNFKQAVEATFGLTEQQRKARFYQLTRAPLESCEAFVLHVEESRARLRLDQESVMLAFEKQLTGELQARVNMRKAMKKMDVGGGVVAWEEVVRGAREL